MIKRNILAAAGLIFLFVLFLFGKTTISKPDFTQIEQASPVFDITAFISKEKQQLTPSQLAYVSKIENSISRGDVKNQSEKQLTQLANFWKDSAKVFPPYAYDLSEAAKLDNSEK